MPCAPLQRHWRYLLRRRSLAARARHGRAKVTQGQGVRSHQARPRTPARTHGCFFDGFRCRLARSRSCLVLCFAHTRARTHGTSCHARRAPRRALSSHTALVELAPLRQQQQRRLFHCQRCARVRRLCNHPSSSASSASASSATSRSAPSSVASRRVNRRGRTHHPLPSSLQVATCAQQAFVPHRKVTFARDNRGLIGLVPSPSSPFGARKCLSSSAVEPPSITSSSPTRPPRSGTAGRHTK